MRTRIGVVLESAEPREVMHFCLLFGYDPHVAVTPTGGADWNGYNLYDLPWDSQGQMVFRASTSEFVAMGIQDSHAVVARADSYNFV